VVATRPWPISNSGIRNATGIGYLIPLMVGLSRLVIHAHSVSEVLAGLMLGFTGEVSGKTLEELLGGGDAAVAHQQQRNQKCHCHLHHAPRSGAP
jgi:hypothetical protein